jgi:RNA polymerase primary sigma factor
MIELRKNPFATHIQHSTKHIKYMRQLKISKSITNRESQSIEKYLQEIGKVDLITAEGEVVLAKRIKQGDHMALEKLTKS